MSFSVDRVLTQFFNEALIANVRVEDTPLNSLKNIVTKTPHLLKPKAKSLVNIYLAFLMPNI